MLKILLLLCFQLVITCFGCTDLSFSSVFSDNLVLQRNAKAAVYGTVKYENKPPQIHVVLKLGNQLHQEVDVFPDESTWKVYFEPVKAGFGFDIIVTCGTQRRSLHHVAFGDVYYCGGQSNMELESYYTFSSKDTLKKLKSNDLFANLHFIQQGRVKDSTCDSESPAFINESPISPWYNVSAALIPNITSHKPKIVSFVETFSAVCLEFGVKLLEQLGDDAIPIGLIENSVGGTVIESWMDPESLDICNVDNNVPQYVSSDLFNCKVAPFVNMTLTGWLWYQGENNVKGNSGNSALHEGYGCKITEMIKSWRKLWSSTPGTTRNDAVFGVVTLAAGGSEGYPFKMGAFRWSQTGSYGSLPSPSLPNTFVVQAYDLEDPWPKRCTKTMCCPHYSETESCMKPDPSWLQTEWYYNNAPSLGAIHPRTKRILGQRLANGIGAMVYNDKSVPFNGPTISGCATTTDSSALVITFDKDMLHGEKIIYEKDNRFDNPDVIGLGDIALCFGDEKICNCVEWVPVAQSSGKPKWHCKRYVDTEEIVREPKNILQVDHVGYVPPNVLMRKAWKAIQKPPEISGSQLHIDLEQFTDVDTTLLKAIRYAWPLGVGEDSCCPSYKVSKGLYPCPIESCPIRLERTRLPANPFFASISNHRCRCPFPQRCGE